MTNFARLRRARTRVVKVQRRIWLVQVAFWPALTLGMVGIATTTAYLARRRRHAAAALPPEPVSEFHTPADEIGSAR